MMELTKEYLLELRQNALAKRQHCLDMVQQANGAVDMVNYLLEQLEKLETENGNNAD
jgi:hypothetical protein